MKLVLICPSNVLYMPYLENYTNILTSNNINFTIINWDRLQIEESSDYRYVDSKATYRKNLMDYYKYTLFIKELLVRENFDKVIIFGLQLSFFMSRYLTKEFKNMYIVDIRDYNKIIKYFNLKKVIKYSRFTVISSPGFESWLADGEYILNHNTNIKEIPKVSCEMKIERDKYVISYIGAIRDLEINQKLLSSLKDSNKVLIKFHGDGISKSDLENYSFNNSIENVEFTGRYEKKDEQSLYAEADLINVIRYGDNEINKDALPNRLYDSLLYGKPFLAYEGNTLAEIIKEKKLGLVISNFDNIENEITNYLDNYNLDEYLQNRTEFLKEIIKENSKFENYIVKFMRE